jgi:hypothetical protein
MFNGFDIWIQVLLFVKGSCCEFYVCSVRLKRDKTEFDLEQKICATEALEPAHHYAADYGKLILAQSFISGEDAKIIHSYIFLRILFW